MAQPCSTCHAALQQGLGAAHNALARDCTTCHGGNAGASARQDAHQGLIAFPGDMDSAAQACGNCHADQVDSVSHSLMHTGKGMVRSTRQVLGEPTDRPAHNELATLTHSPADSLLRKRCAGCHLGRKKTAHRLDATRDRGGGCLACHINDYPETGHPALTAQVSDSRCFGCHSRSSRISLNYAGLAEVDTPPAAGKTGQLDDGRRVEFRPADLHHTAGMGCIDCHTEKGLMGIGADRSVSLQTQAVDITCSDCHQVTRTIRLAQWPDQYRALLPRVPFPADADTRFPVTASGTPLWNIELRNREAWLHRKDGQGRLHIPPYRERDHPLAAQHTRLNCSACHAGWAPQCYGCHLQYDPAGQQFDHVAGVRTKGRWNGQRSRVRNDLPPLGVTPDNQVVPVVPGMIMTVEHPDWPAPRFVRRFTAIEPHTTAAARSCESCHRSSVALGLGQGRFQQDRQGTSFHPDLDRLEDGLAADAWTRPGKTSDRTATVRPFSSREIERILAAPLPAMNRAGAAQPP
ncbi:MAG TPA: hypothetical protein ENK49_04605 [Gammaproteobacteria bacterium]|nr:hypothetical protein [Gammaproteobacteria bacterium]